MPIISALIFTNQNPVIAYTASVFTSGSVISNGLGNQLTSLQLTSSYSTSASYSNTSSYSTSASYVANTNLFSFTNPSTIDTQTTMSVTHSLGGTPSFVRCVLLCSTADLGYSIGDEADISSPSVASGNNIPAQTYGANSSSLFCTLSTSNINMYDKFATSHPNITQTSWKLKMYARL